jgi:hypothetical protein
LHTDKGNLGGTNSPTHCLPSFQRGTTHLKEPIFQKFHLHEHTIVLFNIRVLSFLVVPGISKNPIPATDSLVASLRGPHASISTAQFSVCLALIETSVLLQRPSHIYSVCISLFYQQLFHDLLLRRLRLGKAVHLYKYYECCCYTMAPSTDSGNITWQEIPAHSPSTFAFNRLEARSSGFASVIITVVEHPPPPKQSHRLR